MRVMPMDDDEYWALRDRMTPGGGYHTVFRTILSREDGAAVYTDIVDRLDHDWGLDRDEADDILQELEAERMIRHEGTGRYTVTDRAEDFLREDIGDDAFDRYRQSLQYSRHIQQKTDAVQERQEAMLEADYDTVAMETALEDTEPLDLVAYFIAHPQDAPSFPELDHMMPSRDREDIRETLTYLEQDTDLVEVLESDAYREQGLPHRFYRVKDEVRAYLANETNYLSTDPAHTEAFWTDIYERTRKPDHIKRYEQLPRPGPGGDRND